MKAFIASIKNRKQFFAFWAFYIGMLALILFAVAGCAQLGGRGEAIVLSKGEYGGMREAWLGTGNYCKYLGVKRPDDMTPAEITAFLEWCALGQP
jgi:hypothetical protein